MGACIGCHSCEVACAEQNGLPRRHRWRRVGEIEGGAYPRHQALPPVDGVQPLPRAACLEGCPTGAYEKLANGIVAHHADECIGCQYCTWNCPYSVPGVPARPAHRHQVRHVPAPARGRAWRPACVERLPDARHQHRGVDIAAWRADHSAADAPHLPPSDLTLSTTRIILPDDVPAETFAGERLDTSAPSTRTGRCVWVTLLTQFAVGVVSPPCVDGTDRRGAVAGFVAGCGRRCRRRCCISAARARPARRCGACGRQWLSREVLAFGLFSAAAAGSLAVLPAPGDRGRRPCAVGIAGDLRLGPALRGARAGRPGTAR